MNKACIDTPSLPVLANELSDLMRDLGDRKGHSAWLIANWPTVMHALRKADTPASEMSPPAELARLKEIEHLAWHLMDGSEERVTENEIVVAREDYEALSKLLPEGHP